MTIVGLPDAAVQESRERVQSAIKNAGLASSQLSITLVRIFEIKKPFLEIQRIDLQNHGTKQDITTRAQIDLPARCSIH